MACNFVPSDDIAYISYRQFNDLRKDIFQQQLKLISIFAPTTIVTGNKAARCESSLVVHKDITRSYMFPRTTLTYLARMCQRETLNCEIKIHRKLIIIKRSPEHR